MKRGKRLRTDTQEGLWKTFYDIGMYWIIRNSLDDGALDLNKYEKNMEKYGVLKVRERIGIYKELRDLFSGKKSFTTKQTL